MMNDRIVELINGEIDEENSESESREIRAILESNDEARAYYDDLRKLGSRFSEAGEIEPPPGLRHEVLTATTRAPRPRERARATRSWLMPGRLLDSFTPKLAYAFAAGVAAGIAIFAVAVGFDGGPGETASLRGSIAAWELQAESPVESTVEFELPNGLGDVVVHSSGALVRAELSVQARREAEIAFRYEETVSLEAMSAPSADGYEVTVGSGETILTQSGAGDYILYFENSLGTPFPISVASCYEGVCFKESIQAASR